MAYWISLVKKEKALRPLFLQLGSVDFALISPDGRSRRQAKFEFTDDDFAP